LCNRLKIYSALYPAFYPFDKWWPDATNISLKHGHLPDDDDGFLVLWGGGDIHPSWYNRTNVASQVYDKPSIRDEQEVRMAAHAIKLGLPILGVCRGAQFGCALAGGILVQHVSGHQSDHYMKTVEGKRIVTSSLHHQMMYPLKVEHELLAWSEPSRSGVYKGLTKDELKAFVDKEGNVKEPEVVWFPTVKCLAVQGHPEFMDHDCDFNKYLQQKMEHYGLYKRKIS